MALPTVKVKGSDNIEKDVPFTNAGRAQAADSKPVVLSNEDLAILTSIRDFVDTLETLQGAGNTSLANILAALGDTTPAAVANDTRVQVLNPAVTAAAQVAGRSIGGKLTFTNFGRVAGGSGTISEAGINAKTAQNFAADLFLFNADPTASTITDNVAFALAAADMDKVISVISFAAGNWAAGNPASIARVSEIGRQYQLAAGNTSIFGALVARGTPTFASVSDISVVLKAARD